MKCASSVPENKSLESRNKFRNRPFLTQKDRESKCNTLLPNGNKSGQTNKIDKNPEAVLVLKLLQFAIQNISRMYFP